MKYGMRTPSFRKSIAARTSARRYVRHSLGLKAPRGWGWVTNPRKAAYNRVYNRTTNRAGRGPEALLIGLVIYAVFGILILLVKLVYRILGYISEQISNNSAARQSNTTDTYSAQKTVASQTESYKPSSTGVLCPRCSQPMVMRTARRGRNAGSNFLGCSRFPQCRGTRNCD